MIPSEQRKREGAGEQARSYKRRKDGRERTFPNFRAAKNHLQAPTFPHASLHVKKGHNGGRKPVVSAGAGGGGGSKALTLIIPGQAAECAAIESSGSSFRGVVLD